MSFASVARMGFKFVRSHSNLILTGVSVTGTLAAVYFAVKDTPKCMQELEELEAEGASNKQKAKAVGKNMMRVAVATAISIVAQIANGTLNAKAIDSMLLKYQLATTGAELYKDKTKEIAGEEVAAKIDEAVAQTYKPPKDFDASKKVTHTTHGDDLFCLEILGIPVWFTSDVNFIKNVGVNTKDIIVNENENVTINELACDLGIGSVAALKDNDKTVYGWHPDRFDRYRRDEFFAFYAMMDENDRPYTIVKCTCDPMPLYKPNSPRYH